MFFQRAKIEFIFRVKLTAIAALFLFLSSTGAQAQTETQTSASVSATKTIDAKEVKSEEVKTPAPLMPVMLDYRGVKIGMSADEIKEKLGKPESSDATGFIYRISDSERAQIGLDADKKVRLVVVFYAADSAESPAYADVLGADAAATAKDDGSVYNLVRYPQAGYWVAYSKAAGKDAMIIVTMQKL